MSVAEKKTKESVAGAQAAAYRQTPADLFIAAAVMVFILLISLFPIRSNDIWWHMAVGKELLETRHFITKDPFTFTVTGSPWVPHSYLAGIVFYLVYQIGSAYGLIVLRLILVFFIFTLLFRILKKAEVPFSLAAPFVLVGALVVHSRFLLRPHLFEYVFLMILLGFLLDGRKRTGLRFYGPPVLLQVIWANVHPSFFLGPAIVFLYLAGEAVSAVIGRSRGNFGGTAGDQLKHMAVLLLLLVTASFVNPSPIEFIFQPLGSEQRELLKLYTLEWRSPFDPAIRFGAFHPYYEIFLVFTAVSLILSLVRLRLSAVLLVGMFLYLSLQAHRFRAELVFFTLPLLLIELKAAPFIQAFRRIFSRWKNRGFFIHIVFTLIIVAILIYTARDRVIMGGAVSGRHPVKAFDFVKREDVARRSFHPIGYGSFLLWHLYPERQSFIDGRNFSPTLYRDFLACQTNVDGFNRVIRKYDLDGFVLPVLERSDAGITNLHTALDRFDEWALVYIDSVAFVYVKTDRVPLEWLDKNAYRLYHPVTFGKKSYLAEDLPAVIAEIHRALENSPRATRLWIDLALTNAVLGDTAAARRAAEKALSIDPENKAAREILRRLSSTK